MNPTIHWLRSQVALSGQYGLSFGIPKTRSKVKFAPLEPKILLAPPFKLKCSSLCTGLVPPLDGRRNRVQDNGVVQGPWLFPTTSDFFTENHTILFGKFRDRVDFGRILASEGTLLEDLGERSQVMLCCVVLDIVHQLCASQTFKRILNPETRYQNLLKIGQCSYNLLSCQVVGHAVWTAMSVDHHSKSKSACHLPTEGILGGLRRHTS